MDPVERCFVTARHRHFKIVLPEGDDIRVLAAARGLIDREIARPIVLGAPDASKDFLDASRIERGMLMYVGQMYIGRMMHETPELVGSERGAVLPRGDGVQTFAIRESIGSAPRQCVV